MECYHPTSISHHTTWQLAQAILSLHPPSSLSLLTAANVTHWSAWPFIWSHQHTPSTDTFIHHFFLIQDVKKVASFFFLAVAVCLLSPSEIVTYSSEGLKSMVQFCSTFIFSTIHKKNLLLFQMQYTCMLNRSENAACPYRLNICGANLSFFNF